MLQLAFRRLAPLVLLAALLAPQAGEAAQRRGLKPVRVAGTMGVRPFIGGYFDMNLDDIPGAQPVTGDKFVFGGDLLLGQDSAFGTTYVVGLHMGAGDGDFVLQPLFEVHYRFDAGLPIVPWIGGGVSAKLGFARYQSTNFALTFRLVFGAEWFITDQLALGTQLTVPDIGPRLTPNGVVPIGTVEWVVGPHFRF